MNANVAYEIAELKRIPMLQSPDSWFWGISENISRLKRDVEFSLSSKLNVLIVGETGSGKELLARRVHQERKRRELLSEDEAPFVSINCSTIPEALAESLLFGHERGTLFLDEIQSLSLEIQAKLLRVLQEREIIAATNVPLEILVEEKKFRRDLYFRLNVCPLYIPALRQRKEDLPTIMKGLLNKAAYELRRSIPEISPAAYELMLNYSWPGNIRELEHALMYGLLRSSNCIEVENLPPAITGKLEQYLSIGDWT